MNGIIMSAAVIVVSTSVALGFTFTQLGSVQFEMKEVFKCDDSGTKEFDGVLRLNRKNRTLVVMEGNVTLKVPLEDTMTTTAVVYYWSNGGWKEVYKFNNVNICRDLATLLGGLWTSVWSHAGLTPPIRCPIPKGDYELKDFDTQDFMQIKMPAMAVGKFKVQESFLRNKEIIGCVNFISEIKSKPIFG